MLNVLCTSFYRNSMESQQRVRMMEELDVCSPKFSFSRAESEVKKQRERMLCDVLLDQKVLPGVGNIIKNEALFDSGLHPAVKVKYKNCQICFYLVFKCCKDPMRNRNPCCSNIFSTYSRHLLGPGFKGQLLGVAISEGLSCYPR